MKTNKLSYEEQVLKIGNGKMLEPGFYNVDLEKVEDINGFLNSRTPNEKTDSIRYAIFEKDDTSIQSEKCYNLRNMCAVVLPQNLRNSAGILGYLYPRSRKFISSDLES